MPNFVRETLKLRSMGALLCVGLAMGLGACSTAKTQAQTFSIGQRATAGRLSYLVADAEWRQDVPGGRQPAKNRVLQLHLLITNSGGMEANIPMLRLLDAAGNEIGEVSEIEGNPRWLGMIRRLQPSMTEEGNIYFDVPVGAYRLEVVDNSDSDAEKVAYVEIPASLAPPAPAPPTNGK